MNTTTATPKTTEKKVCPKTLEAPGKIPQGCLACGGPYPSCKSSCPIFDD